MLPTLSEGQLLLIRYAVRARPGDLVIARLPDAPSGQRRPLSVKRLIRYEHDGRVWLEADNHQAAHRVDSWTVGALPASAVTARVLLPMRHPRRRRSG